MGAQGGGELEEDMVAVDEVLERRRVQGGYEALVAWAGQDPRGLADGVGLAKQLGAGGVAQRRLAEEARTGVGQEGEC